jgi:hypothetical protein
MGKNKKGVFYIYFTILYFLLLFLVLFLFFWILSQKKNTSIGDYPDDDKVYYTNSGSNLEELLSESVIDRATNLDSSAFSTTDSDNNSEITTVQNTKEKDNYLLVIGDSRTVGMELTVNENDNIQYIAVPGEGYNLLKENLDNIKNFYQQYETDITSAKIVCNLGVNDLSQVNTYKETYENLLKEGILIAFMTVNPVEDSLSDYTYTVTNEEIDNFNDIIKALDIEVLDTNKYLKDISFETTDGLHYTDDTYNKLYQYLCEYYEITVI